MTSAGINTLFLKLTLLCYLMRIATTKCPQSCSCDEASIICTCEDILGGKNGTKLLLSKLNNFQFISYIIIHSCDTVIIPTRTFEGIIFNHRFEIIKVKNLIIESYAFRGILQSPSEVIFENVHFNRILPNAFSGLQNLKYLWFRNVTVDTVCSHSFEHLIGVDYFYFRDATISRMDEFSFGNIHRINHLFFRGNIVINSMGDSVFHNSAIKILTFEGNLMASDKFLKGGKFKRIELLRCNWKTEVEFTLHSSPTALSADIIKVYDCSIKTLSLATFSNATTVKIEKCEIGSVLTTADLSAGGIETVIVRDSHINIISNLSLRDATELKFESSNIDSILSQSFYSSKIAAVTFKKSKIGKISSRAFEKFNTALLSFDFCWIGIMSSGMFDTVTITDLVLNNTHVGLIQKDSFSSLNAQRIFILNSKINDIQASPFLNTEVSHMIMNNNELLSGDFKTMFYALEAQFLDVTNNSFVCDEDDCETNALFTSKSLHQISWNFESNFCVQPEACKAEPQWSNQNILCRFSRSIVKCYCKNDSPALVPFVNTSVLLMSDCTHLDLNFEATFYLAKLYIFYSNLVLIHNLPSKLRTLTILHSKVLLKSNSLNNTKLKQFELISSKIDNFEAFALKNAVITNFLVYNTNMKNAEETAFEGAKIHTFLGNKSEFYGMNTFWSSVENVTLLDSYINEPSQLLMAKTLCFKTLFISCECFATSLLEKNSCSDGNVICNEDNYESVEICRTNTTKMKTDLDNAASDTHSLLLLFLAIISANYILFAY